MIIAIDGPSGVGKGTIAREVARTLGYRHIDTGAMYRAVAWFAVNNRISLDDERAVSEAASGLVIEVNGGAVSVNGRDVSREIRTPAIDRAAAKVARLPAVRSLLVRLQQALGSSGGVVMEGRDIGTVVFPGAEVKVYLDASREERARRRAADPAHGGGHPFEEVARELNERDESDMTRTASPLAPASDAHVIDTTGVPIAEVVERVLAVIRQRTGTG
ncbi:MAG: (d)CMP kinase [Vicinamibacterales bacterium]